MSAFVRISENRARPPDKFIAGSAFGTPRPPLPFVLDNGHASDPSSSYGVYGRCSVLDVRGAVHGGLANQVPLMPLVGPGFACELAFSSPWTF